ncbi:DUF1307 domain-containing protein [Gemella sanguinis]
MKKFLKIIAPLLATLLLVTACSSETSNNNKGESSEKQKVFTSNNSEGESTEVTIFYSGDNVNRMSSKATYNIKGTSPDEEYNSVKKSFDENLKDVSGVTYSVEKKDNKININYDVDFTKINYDKDREKLGFKKPTLDEERKLSNVEQQLENNNLKEKK